METFIALTYILLAVALHFMTTPMHSYILWVIPQIGLIVVILSPYIIDYFTK